MISLRARRSFLAITTLSLLVAARTADLVVTFHFNPSLSDEANPIVSLFGGGAGSLVPATVAISALSATGLLAFWFGQSLSLKMEPPNLRGFLLVWVRKVILDRHPLRDYLHGGSYTKEGMQAFRLFGLALSWALIFGSFTAVHAWFATRDVSEPTTYQLVYSWLRVGRYNYLASIVAVAGLLFGIMLFFVCEYYAIRHRKSEPRITS